MVKEIVVDNNCSFNLLALPNSEIITVSQLNKLAKTLLENNMPITWVKGEISGVKNYSHIYFDLKDDKAKISCVLFSRLLPLLDFKLDNGQQVEVKGRVTLFETNGSYQINVERIRKVGVGDLWEAYNQLLNKLRLEGLFDVKHKKQLPLMPNKIGIITSKEGAVVRDIVTTLKKRMPSIELIIYHSMVQGNDAFLQLSKAIRIANKRKEVDVIILCRGGGSLEDLWCFNNEILAREIFNSVIPIISAVGHETDNTISDFVADLRAPTPTAAAILVVKSRDEWLKIIENFQNRIRSSLEMKINYFSQVLDLYYHKLLFINPTNQINNRLSLLSQLQERLNISIQVLINNKLYVLNNEKIHLIQYIKENILRNFNLVNNYISQLQLINPNEILKRGYSIIKTIDGKIIFNKNQINIDDELQVVFSKDIILCKYIK